MAPAASSISVPGSGTGEMVDAVAGAPAIEGSKMNVPPAPTVKLVPPGRAVLAVSNPKHFASSCAHRWGRLVLEMTFAAEEG